MKNKADKIQDGVQESDEYEATILKLSIKRFRGIENFEWHPNHKFNVIIGGGDVGKSTVLDAISLLLSPSSSIVLSESDYWMGDASREFLVEGVFHIPQYLGQEHQGKLNLPWEWDGENATSPRMDIEDEAIEQNIPAYIFRVRGTSDLELSWEIMLPNEEIYNLPVALRRAIGVVRLSAEDNNDRDFRLVYGSSLDKMISDSGLRARLAQQISKIDVNKTVSETGIKSLKALDDSLKSGDLPNEIKLGLTASKGVSIGSLIGIIAKKGGKGGKGEIDTLLPLSSWGAGTRRMATLEISSASSSEASIVVIDEVERGLEPYRQRKLLKRLQENSSQNFVTTHSPFIIQSFSEGTLWYMSHEGRLGELDLKKVGRHLGKDPEAFLAKSVVVGEGDTEVGFLKKLFLRVFNADPLDYGIKLTSAGGNEEALNLLEALENSGIIFSGLVDNEGNFLGRWERLKNNLNDHLLQWNEGCLEQNIIPKFTDDEIDSLFLDNDNSGERLRTLADRLKTEDKSLANIKQLAPNFRELIILAATGSKEGAESDSEKKAWGRHAQRWFKSIDGGMELAERAIGCESWGEIEHEILPLFNAVLKTVGKTEIVTI